MRKVFVLAQAFLLLLACGGLNIDWDNQEDVLGLIDTLKAGSGLVRVIAAQFEDPAKVNAALDAIDASLALARQLVLDGHVSRARDIIQKARVDLGNVDGMRRAHILETSGDLEWKRWKAENPKLLIEKD